MILFRDSEIGNPTANHFHVDVLGTGIKRVHVEQSYSRLELDLRIQTEKAIGAPCGVEKHTNMRDAALAVFRSDHS